MDAGNIISELKTLTLALAAGEMTRQAAVDTLYQRINAEEIFRMKKDDPQADFITQVFVSLEHLTDEGFATSPEEIRYFAECFEGKKIFSPEEVRKFQIGDFENTPPPRKNRRTNTPKN